MKGDKRQSSETDPLLPSTLDIRKQKQSPVLHYGALFALLSAAFIKPVCFDIIFPFINQMILENGIVGSPEEVGFYSGTVESLFAVLALLSVMPWTYISDNFGRKPVVLYGRVGMAVSMALFGMSKSYWMMMLTRCICGFFGGTQTTVKVMVAEVFPDKLHRISAFSALQISIRVGQVAGQSIGGWFSHPERNFAIFDTYFWRKYPFSLPCFLACAMGLMSWVYGSIALRETLPSKIDDDDTRSSTELCESCTVCDHASEASKVSRRSLSSTLTPQVNGMLIGTFMMTFVSETFYALYPLYAFTPLGLGGLGFSEAQIGTHMAVRAIIIVCIIILSAPLQHKLGTVRTYQLGMATWPLSVIFLPVLNRMARSANYGDSSPWFWLVFSAFYLSWGVGSLVWPCIQVMTANVSPSAEDLATVSGLSQVLQSTGEALAPAFITSLFAFSLEHGILDGNFTYVVLLGIGILGYTHALTLKESVDQIGKSTNMEEGRVET